jgi:DNA-binding beta-propeller fold protein YncE
MLVVLFGVRNWTIHGIRSLRLGHWNQFIWRRVFLLIALHFASLALSCAKRTNPAPKPVEVPPFEFLSAWGDKGNDPGKLDMPAAFAADSMGRVFFADPGSGFVHKFKSNGTPLLSFEDFHVRHAAGIAVDSGGAIYVADAERGNVLIFFPDGTFLRSIRITPQRHLSAPLGISIDDQGNLYVPDAAGSRILKFDARGRQVKSWKVPQNAQAADERPIAVAATQDGTTFVAYSKSGRIERYSSDGSWITSWSAAGNDAATNGAVTGFTVGGQYVFTVGATPPQIRVWALDGTHKLDDNLGGHVDGVEAPQIVVTSGAELLVLDAASPRVYRFRIHLPPLKS